MCMVIKTQIEYILFEAILQVLFLRYINCVFVS